MNTMMNYFGLFWCIVMSTSLSLYGQEGSKTYSLRQGQTLDFIFINTKVGVEEEIKQYFKEVYPVASAAGYNRLPGLKVMSSPSQGNYHPDIVVTGFWNSYQSRTSFLEKILDKSPDFYQTRREIWSTFNLVYFDLQEDVSFSIQPGKYYTVTNLWLMDPSDIDTMLAKWNQAAAKAGGKNILTLSGGRSPSGYFYTPALLMITEWNSKGAWMEGKTAQFGQEVKHVEQWEVH